jgi:hypothetical protein
MSTGTGTLQAPRTSRSIWLAAVVASLLMLTIGIGAFFVGRDRGTQTPKSVVGGAESTEISGGVVGGVTTSAVGITAGSSSLAVAARPAVMAEIIAARNAADADPAELGGTAGNTPSELSGGMFEQYGRHQRI